MFVVYDFQTEIYNPFDVIVNKSHISSSRNLTSRLANSLLLMEKLEHLEISDYHFSRSHINPVIVQNAASLRVLETHEILPSSQQGPVVNSQLKKLECRFLSPGTVCPVLEELMIYPCCALGPVDQLPILTMRKLVFYSKSRDERLATDSDGNCTAHNDEEPGEFHVKILQAAKRLVHLTHLELFFDFDYDDIPDEYFAPTLLDNFTSLVHLELTFPHNDFAFDQKVVQLVRQNPGLRHLKLNEFDLSDTALTSVAGLRYLRHLELYGFRGRFTVNGVLALFRSPLRPLLLFAGVPVRSETTHEERKEIWDEIDLIAAERGKPLKEIEEWFPDYFTFQFED